MQFECQFRVWLSPNTRHTVVTTVAHSSAHQSCSNTPAGLADTTGNQLRRFVFRHLDSFVFLLLHGALDSYDADSIAKPTRSGVRRERYSRNGPVCRANSKEMNQSNPAMHPGRGMSCESHGW